MRFVVCRFYRPKQEQNGATAATDEVVDGDASTPDLQDNKGDSTETKSEDAQQGYYHPPKNGVQGYPDAGKGAYNPQSKRWRWKDKNGDTLEWDKQHGEVEKYDKAGNKHKVANDPKIGNKLKPGIDARKTCKFTLVDIH